MGLGGYEEIVARSYAEKGNIKFARLPHKVIYVENAFITLFWFLFRYYRRSWNE
jgi:hypothetical protein